MFACLPKLPKKNKLACSNVKDIVQQVQQITETIVHDEMPLVSVIVPCYNVEEYIDQCLTSILNNGYQNIELLVINDRSTDGTVDHIKALMKKDNRIQLFHNSKDHNIYGGACRNIGLDHAKGKYVCFVDSDDYILPGMIQFFVKRSEQTECEECWANHYELFSDGRYVPNNPVKWKPRKESIFLKQTVSVWGKMYRMDFLRSFKAKFQAIKNSNDNLFHIQVCLHLKKIECIEECFYVYRVQTPTSVQRDQFSGNNLICIIQAVDEMCRYVNEFGDKISKQHFCQFLNDITLRHIHNNIRVYGSEFIDNLETLIRDNGFYTDQIKKTICSLRVPLVSVIVPTWNSENTIDRSLKSILENGYQNIEVIVVDDMSTDRTSDKVKAWQQKDRRIRFFRNETGHHIYGGGGRNIGMKNANGKYIAFVDSDDYVLPGMFQEVVQKMERLDLDICAFQYIAQWVDGRRAYKWNGISKQFLKNQDQEVYKMEDTTGIFQMLFSACWNKMYKQQFLKSINAHHQEIATCDDNSFHIQVLSNAKRISNIEKEFYVYVKGNVNSVEANKNSGGKNLTCILKAWNESYEVVKGNLIAEEQFIGFLEKELLNIYEKVKYDKKTLDEITKFICDNFSGRVQLHELLDKMHRELYRVVVSFATWKPRLLLEDDMFKFLNSIVNQKCNVRYHIVMNLSKDDVKYISQKLWDYLNQNNIEVHICTIDLKSNNKYVYSMQRYSHLPVITVDDDWVYHERLIQELYNEHIKHPRTIIAGRCVKMEFAKDGSIKPYREWRVVEKGQKSFDMVSTGCCGVLYPSEFCTAIDDGIQFDIIRYDCMERDDLLLHLVAIRHGFMTKTLDCQLITGASYGLCTVKEELSSSRDVNVCLWKKNKNQNMNDKTISLMLNELKMRSPSMKSAKGEELAERQGVKNALVYCVNNKQKYVDMMINSINSFAKSNSELLSNTEVIVFSDVDSLDLHKISKGVKYKVVKDFSYDYSSLLSTQRYGKIVYLKFELFINPIFNEYDNVLYLDSDTEIVSQIDHILSLDGFIVMPNDVKNHLEGSNLIPNYWKYANSGTILLHPKKLGKDVMRKMFDNMVLSAKKYGNVLKYPDQDIFNHVFSQPQFSKFFSLLDDKLDRNQYMFGYQIKKELSNGTIPKDVSIIHHVGCANKHPYVLRFLEK